MGWLEYFASGKLSRFYDKIKVVAKENGKKPFPMLLDLGWCSLRYGAGLADYVNFKFYDLPASERKKYVTVLDTDRFYEKLSPSKYKTYFTIKPNFLKNFAPYIHREFFTNDQSLDDLKGFLSRHEFFMEKPIDGLGGHGVERIESASITDPETYLEHLKTDNCLLDEVIVQNEEVTAFAPGSVNTIRICSYANNDDSFIWYACMRFGNGIAHVDNFHQGGMTVAVDLETGKLKGKAIDKVGKEYDRHPYSNLQFDGFAIPHWDFITKMVKEAALVNQKIHVVGWDVAVTPDGATFVEGNRRPGWDLIQSLDHAGSKWRMNELLDRFANDEAKKKEK